jgi:hypothetical protein
MLNLGGNRMLTFDKVNSLVPVYGRGCGEPMGGVITGTY